MLVLSGAWDTLTMGGEEVDIDIFYGPDSTAAAAAVEALGSHPAVSGVRPVTAGSVR